eukprot:jgi/Psemu1/27388/gm1.27388_g
MSSEGGSNYHPLRSSRNQIICLSFDSPNDIRMPSTSSCIIFAFTPSTLSRSGHHSASPCEPSNFKWTFNPQNEIASSRCLPKPASSPQHSLSIPLLSSEALAKGTALASAAPAYI